MMHFDAHRRKLELRNEPFQIIEKPPPVTNRATESYSKYPNTLKHASKDLKVNAKANSFYRPNNQSYHSFRSPIDLFNSLSAEAQYNFSKPQQGINEKQQLSVHAMPSNSYHSALENLMNQNADYKNISMKSSEPNLPYNNNAAEFMFQHTFDFIDESQLFRNNDQPVNAQHILVDPEMSAVSMSDCNNSYENIKKTVIYLPQPIPTTFQEGANNSN